MHISIDPTHCYAERWGHTLGFKATGSLSVHTTAAVWNAHHAWELRAKPAWKACIRLRFLCCTITVPLNAILTREKQKRDKNEEEKKNWIWNSNIHLFLLGSIDHRKQTAFMSDVWQDFLSCYLWRVCIFACLSQWYLITVTGEYWKEVGCNESEFGVDNLCCTVEWIFYSTAGDKAWKAFKMHQKIVAISIKQTVCR